MNLAAIICEYNPLHNGHVYHIEKTAELLKPDGIIAVMSGNFTQRGEAAIANKYLRARRAVLNGADMVIELPALYATSSARYFAKGAISVLSNIKDIKYLSFGAETDNISALIDAVKTTESISFNKLTKEYISSGLSYPAAAEKAYSDITGVDNPLLTPNNILAGEYIRNAGSIMPELQFNAVLRRGEGYHSKELNPLSSARGIREGLEKGLCVSASLPSCVYDDIKEHNARLIRERAYALALQKLSESPDNVYEDNEGIVNRMIKSLQKSTDYSSLVGNTHTKRYTISRIKRVILHLILNHTADMINAPADYTRVLAVRRDRTDLLSLVKNIESSSALYANDLYADKVYGMLTGDNSRYPMQLVDCEKK